jgi:hypothetical protein
MASETAASSPFLAVTGHGHANSQAQKKYPRSDAGAPHADEPRLLASHSVQLCLALIMSREDNVNLGIGRD